MKTKEELNALKEEVETLNKKLHELSDEELAQVSGGVDFEPAVKDVLTGKYGNGEERRQNLGIAYFMVQNEVNRRLGYPPKKQ